MQYFADSAIVSLDFREGERGKKKNLSWNGGRVLGRRMWFEKKFFFLIQNQSETI